MPSNWVTVKIPSERARQRLRQIASATNRSAASVLEEAIWRLGAHIDSERSEPMPAFEGRLPRGRRPRIVRAPRMTHGQRVVKILAESDRPMHTRSLARELGITYHNAKSTLSRMVNAGLIERVAPGRFRVRSPAS